MHLKTYKWAVASMALSVVWVLSGCGAISGVSSTSSHIVSTTQSHTVNTTNTVTTGNPTPSGSMQTKSASTPRLAISSAKKPTTSPSANQTNVPGSLVHVSKEIASLNGKSEMVQLQVPKGWNSYHVFVGDTGGTEWLNPQDPSEQIVVVASGNASGTNLRPGPFTDTSHKNPYNQNGDSNNPNFGVEKVPYVGYGISHIFKNPILTATYVEVWVPSKRFATQILSSVSFQVN